MTSLLHCLVPIIIWCLGLLLTYHRHELFCEIFLCLTSDLLSWIWVGSTPGAITSLDLAQGSSLIGLTKSATFSIYYKHSCQWSGMDLRASCD